MAKRPPIKTKGHTEAQRIKRLERQMEQMMKTATDLITSVGSLEAAVAALEAAPKPASLIRQDQLDDVTARVDAATAKVVANTPTA